jgi:hypothetical protein
VHSLFKDEIVKLHNLSPNIRSGKFLWMDEDSKRRYLCKLHDRIDKGYYFSDSILTKVVDEIAPVMDDCMSE